MHGRLLRVLQRQGHLVATSVPGVYGFDGLFEGLVASVAGAISRIGAELGARVVRYPPAIARDVLESTGYFHSFPHLGAVVSVWPPMAGRESAAATALFRGASWVSASQPSKVALCPSACYPVYAAMAGRSVAQTELYDVMGYCFRAEPSPDPFRMQCFRMHELVCVGDPEAVRGFLDQAHDAAVSLLRGLGLEVACAAAVDPFFGPIGRGLSHEQRARDLKQEYVFPTAQAEVALASVNNHEAHFTRPHRITANSGRDAVAVSACVGFGLERIVLAAFECHGADVQAWPESVKRGFGQAA